MSKNFHCHFAWKYRVLNQFGHGFGVSDWETKIRSQLPLVDDDDEVLWALCCCQICSSCLYHVGYTSWCIGNWIHPHLIKADQSKCWYEYQRLCMSPSLQLKFNVHCMSPGHGRNQSGHKKHHEHEKTYCARLSQLVIHQEQMSKIQTSGGGYLAQFLVDNNIMISQLCCHRCPAKKIQASLFWHVLSHGWSMVTQHRIFDLKCCKPWAKEYGGVGVAPAVLSCSWSRCMNE